MINKPLREQRETPSESTKGNEGKVMDSSREWFINAPFDAQEARCHVKLHLFTMLEPRERPRVAADNIFLDGKH